MIRRIAIFLLTAQLLFGSMFLPMGDFSALKELPRMYKAYEKVVSPDEKGVFDFIGDYLLGGKDLLGHNRHDQPSKPGAMQFQHSGTFAMLFHPLFQLSGISHAEMTAHTIVPHLQAKLGDYSSSLFRPPLA